MRRRITLRLARHEFRLSDSTRTIDAGFDDGFDDFADHHDDFEEPPAPSIWKHLDGGDVSTITGCTKDGVELKLRDIPEDVIARQDEFYGCSKCGKIFWQGSHWKDRRSC